MGRLNICPILVSIAIVLQVLVPGEGGEGALGKADLSGVILRRADTLHTREIAQQIADGAKLCR